MIKKNDLLESLVSKGSIKSYVYEDLNEWLKPGHSFNRNRQRLSLELNDGQKLVFSTWADTDQNSGFYIQEKPDE